jgi:uncharacterized protein (TIGR00290 family)
VGSLRPVGGTAPGRARVWLSWSSGKDSALTLHYLQRAREFEVTRLLTTVTAPFERVSMHGVREALLTRQAEEVGIPVHRVRLPFPCSNEEYEIRMGHAVAEAQREGVGAFAFGDLFLEDIRAYREARLAPTGLRALFPLWGRDTRRLAEEMIDVGIRATLVCVDPRKLDRSFAGRSFDRDLLKDLPPGIDPCGERGEFHTFVHAGPMFRAAIPVVPGEVVERDGFVFADLRPG